MKQSSKLSLSLTKLGCYFFVCKGRDVGWLRISDNELDKGMEDLWLECPFKNGLEIHIIHNFELRWLHFKHLFG